MRAIMVKMTVLMGLVMSFILSLTGTLMGGHFTLPSWLMSFGISFIISLIIGFVVPIKKLGDGLCGCFKIVPESFKGTLVSACVSNLIYTPIITIIMVVVMLKNVAAHMPADQVQNVPPIGRVLPGSLIVSFLVGYVVIVIVQPLLIKSLTKNLKR